MSVSMSRIGCAVTLAGGLAVGASTALAQGATTLPDAQVESNVLKALAGAPELSTQNIQFVHRLRHRHPDGQCS